MSAKSRKPAKETPFYELPNVTTSADIIAAARHSIRTVDTRRPEVRSQTLYLIITFQVIYLSLVVRATDGYLYNFSDTERREPDPFW